MKHTSTRLVHLVAFVSTLTDALSTGSSNGFASFFSDYPPVPPALPPAPPVLPPLADLAQAFADVKLVRPIADTNITLYREVLSDPYHPKTQCLAASAATAVGGAVASNAACAMFPPSCVVIAGYSVYSNVQAATQVATEGVGSLDPCRDVPLQMRLEPQALVLDDVAPLTGLLTSTGLLLLLTYTLMKRGRANATPRLL